MIVADFDSLYTSQSKFGTILFSSCHQGFSQLLWVHLSSALNGAKNLQESFIKLDLHA